jgi:hypothetical protein
MSVPNATCRRLAIFTTLLVLSVLAIGLTGCAEDQTDGNLGPAAIAITYPEQDAFVNQSRFRVRGTAEGTEEVDVNGTTAEVVGGEWEALVTFEEGAQTVTASARDSQHTVDFVVDTIAPAITLESPVRGLFVEEDDAGEVTFEGVASDEGSGLQVLALDDVAVSYDDQGSFAHDASLDLGYNEFEIRAVDRAGNESTKLRAVMYGPLADPTSEIESAGEILLSASALETASQVIESLMTPERITQFVQTSLADNDTIEVDSVSFDALDVELIPNSPDANFPDGHLAIKVAVNNLSMAGTATVSGEPYDVTITLDEVTITTEVVLAASEAGGLDISFGQSELDFVEEDLHFSFADVNEDDLGQGWRDTLRSLAVVAAKAAFSGLLSDELFDQLYDPDVLRRQVELFGRTLEFQLYIREARTSSEGIYLNASVAIVSPRYEEVPEAPGALDLPLGQRTAPKVEGDVRLTTQRTALNRVLHGIWRSGLLTLELAGDDFAGYELPVELSASSLALLLDSRISSIDTQQTPAGLNLRPQLPPVASLVGSDQAESDGDVGIKLGELLVDLHLLPEGREPIKLATVALFVDATVAFEARDGKLALGIEAVARADLDEEPEIDLDDRDVEALFSDLIALTSQMIGDNLELTAAAELEWLRIENPQAEVHGEQLDQLSVTADLNANPDGVE